MHHTTFYAIAFQDLYQSTLTLTALVMFRSELSNYIQTQIDLSPRGIRKRLELNKPIYARTAAYGHFGREPTLDGGFTWEKLDLVQNLKVSK